MTIQAKTYLKAIHPLEPDVATTTEARRFVLHFNHSKERSNKRRSDVWESVEGTQYGDGWVTLANRTNYENMSELKYMVGLVGESRIDPID
jgi:hypothetical protein